MSVEIDYDDKDESSLIVPKKEKDLSFLEHEIKEQKEYLKKLEGLYSQKILDTV